MLYLCNRKPREGREDDRLRGANRETVLSCFGSLEISITFALTKSR